MSVTKKECRGPGGQPAAKHYIFPFFQRLTGSGGPGGSGISSNPQSLNVIAGKPRADFPVCLRVDAIVAGDLGGDSRAFLGVLSSTLSWTDIDCTERVSELGKFKIEEILKSVGRLTVSLDSAHGSNSCTPP